MVRGFASIEGRAAFSSYQQSGATEMFRSAPKTKIAANNPQRYVS
jgi:hypothetical protein